MQTKVQAARAAYDALKLRIAEITGDASVADSMDTKFLGWRAKQAGLQDEYIAAREAWWTAQCEANIAAPQSIAPVETVKVRPDMTPAQIMLHNYGVYLLSEHTGGGTVNTNMSELVASEWLRRVADGTHCIGLHHVAGTAYTICLNTVGR